MKNKTLLIPLCFMLVFITTSSAYAGTTFSGVGRCRMPQLIGYNTPNSSHAISTMNAPTASGSAQATQIQKETQMIEAESTVRQESSLGQNEVTTYTIVAK